MQSLQFRLMRAAAVCIIALNVQCNNCGRENIRHNWTGEMLNNFNIKHYEKY